MSSGTPHLHRITLIKYGAMGDILMTTPLLRQLRSLFTEAEIDYWLAQPFQGLLAGNPHLSQVIPFSERAMIDRPGEFLSVVQKIHARHYDAIFVLDKHPIFGLLARLGGAPHRAGFARNATMSWMVNNSIPYGALRHEVFYYLDLLQCVGAQPDYTDLELDYYPRDSAWNQSEAFFSPGKYAVCINSGGNNVREASHVRRLPAPLFEEALRQLAQHGSVALIGSAADRAFYESCQLPEQVLNLAGQLSLPQSARLLEQSAHIWSTDCGAMHLASAVRAKSIATVWGPTHPLRKKPLITPGHALWKDESAYDPAYEIWGKPTGGKFYQSITSADLEATTHWEPAAS